jgi:hypothetical protein
LNNCAQIAYHIRIPQQGAFEIFMHTKNAGIFLVLVCLVLSFLIVFFWLSAPQNQDAPLTQSNLVLAHDKGNMPWFHQSFSRQGKKAESEIGTGFIPAASPSTDLYMT